jgi:hypothetical protein
MIQKEKWTVLSVEVDSQHTGQRRFLGCLTNQVFLQVEINFGELRRKRYICLLGDEFLTYLANRSIDISVSLFEHRSTGLPVKPIRSLQYNSFMCVASDYL